MHLARWALCALVPSLALACKARSSEPAPGPPAASTATPVPPSASAAAPEGDLDAEIAARIDMARGQLGANIPVRVEHRVFVLVGDRPGPWFDAAAALADKALDAFFHGRFDKPPAGPVTVYAFSSRAAFDRYVRKRFPAGVAESHEGDLGLYRADGSLREIFANLEPGPETLGHELVHPILESDFPTAPKWLAEGIASLYEYPKFPSAGEIRGADNWRRGVLLAALASKDERKEARLDRLFGMTDEAFLQDGPTHYAAARYVCLWLEGKGKLWDFYRAWRDGVGEDPSGEKAFARVVGKTPQEAEAEWEAWATGAARR